MTNEKILAQFLREQHALGSRITMKEPHSPSCNAHEGEQGTLERIDDEAGFHVKWDSGRVGVVYPVQDLIRVHEPEPQILKLYMPITAEIYSRESECNRGDGEFGPETYELHGEELVPYAAQIFFGLSENAMPEEAERGIMHWYHVDDSVNQKVKKVVFTSEVRDGSVWGVASCLINCPLTDSEMVTLKDYIAGQASDGWGEGFEQKELNTDLGEMYVHLWNFTDWSIKAEEELFAPKIADGLPELCFSTLASTGDLIVIKRGETGYYPSDWSTKDTQRNREIADEQNRRLGVSAAQREAMECGSMCGWDVPGADPRNYEKTQTFEGMTM